MKNSLFWVIILFCSISFSQDDKEIKNLLELREELSTKIKEINDSITKINIRIASIESKSIIEKINDSSYTSIARKGAKLRKSLSTFSELITVFETDKKVILLDYDTTIGIYKVCQNKVCGYMNEVWIKENQSTIDLQIYLSDLNGKKNKILLYKNSLDNNLKNKIYTQKKGKKDYSKQKNNRTSIFRSYIRGPRGGCYYINSKGNKTYVDRSLCN